MELKVDPGTLLAAWPDLMDPNFMHSVVLVCNHQAEGAFGLVVNRPMGITADKLLPDHPLMGRLRLPVHLGGPVDHSTMHLVHTLPDRIPGGVPICGDLTLGGDLDALGKLVEDRPAPDGLLGNVRLFLGYSGWAAGQLESELSVGSWVPAPFSLDAVFAQDPRPVWRAVVRSVRSELPWLEDLPPDVSWN